MYTLTLRTVQVSLFLFISSTLVVSNTVAAQSYHRPVHPVQKLNDLLDSVESSHLQISIHQPDRSFMKFHISILNPVARAVTLTIQKQDDVFFSETIVKEQYENVYDLTQLEDGNYLIQISNGKEKISKSLSISTETRVDRMAKLN